MKTTSLVEVVATFAWVTNLVSAAAPHAKRVIRLDLERRYPADLRAYERNRLRRRDNTVEGSLVNEETLYFADVKLGTPAQSLRLHIDTGSSDLWVNTASSSLCSRQDQCEGGTFDPNASSTIQLVNRDFNISYVDGSGAVGDYVADTLVFSDVTLSNFQFGLGEVSTSTEGVLGIGYTDLEVQVQRAGLNAYPNLPQALKDDGQIARNAYSLWLNDQESSTGTILFGGVNSAKYQGDLATVPILPAGGSYFELAVALTGVSVDGSSLSSSSLPVAALLDSGTTLTYLPYDMANAIFNKVGAKYSNQLGYGYVSCSLAQQDKTVEYTFSGQTISVSYEELVIQDGAPASSGRGSSSSSQRCIFGIAPTDGPAVFGDTFLRSAYVVYDLENNQISLAQTVFNATDDNIQEIPSGTSLPPGATAVPSPVTSVAGVPTGGSVLNRTVSTNVPDNATIREFPSLLTLLLSVAGVLIYTI